MRGRDEIGYYPVYGQRAFYVQPGPGPATSSREMFDLTVAVLALAVIFGMPQMRMALDSGWGVPGVLLFFVVALIAVMVCIFPHEMAHKYIARSHGYWAEFRRSDFFLAIGLFTSLLGFSFIAAPGAVMIRGNLTREDNGRISAAGPLTNAVVGFLFLPIALATASAPIIGYISIYIVIVSAWLGTFNMIPFWIFDGRKVWDWNKGIYIGLLAVLLALLAVADMNFHFLGIL